MDDQATYELMAEAKTTAMFQLESRGMKDLIRRLKPDRFEDIVALVALFRPGPLESAVGDFIDHRSTAARPARATHRFSASVAGARCSRRHGDLPEQSQIAQVLAGYTLGGATCCTRWARRSPGDGQDGAASSSRSVKRRPRRPAAPRPHGKICRLASTGCVPGRHALLSYPAGWKPRHHRAASNIALVLSAG